MRGRNLRAVSNQSAEGLFPQKTRKGAAVLTPEAPFRMTGSGVAPSNVGAPTEFWLCTGQSLAWPICATAAVRVSEVAGRFKVRPLHLPRPKNVGAPTFPFWEWIEVAG